jgi:uncharacterized protein YukE/flagellum-specific peptidoglycan hydrolase FlgJ
VIVDRLETLFTANLDDLEAGVRRADALRSDVDGSTAEVELIAQAEDALRQINDLRDELDDVSSTRTRAEIEADADKAVKTANDIAEKLEKINDAEARPHVDLDVDGFSEGRKRVTADMDELGKNADSNAQEMASAFTGELDGIVEYAQEMLGEISEVMGLAWAPVGIAAAAAIGLAMAEAEKLAAKINENKELGAEWAESFNNADAAERIEALRDRFTELGATIRDERKWYELWQEDAYTGLDQVVRAADEGLVSLTAFMGAFDTTDPQRRLEEMESLLADVRDEQERYNEANKDAGWNAEAARAAGDKRDHLREVGDLLKDEIDQQRVANEVEEASARALEARAEAAGMTVEQLEAMEAATVRATEAQEDYLAALEDTADPVDTYEGLLKSKEDAERIAAEATAKATEDSKDSWRDYVGDVKVSTQELIDEWNRQAAQAAAFEDNLALIAANGGQALADELRAKGPEVAGAVADVIAKSSPAEQRAAIEAHAGASGREVVNKMAGGISANGWKVEAAANGVIRAVHVTEDIDVPISVTWSPSQLDGVLDNIQRNTRSIVVGTTVVRAMADGGVVESYADGGLREDHVAQIAPAGAWRVWAEDETGGEAYIPLSPAKRARSMDVLDEVARRFGAALVPYADGGVAGGYGTAGAPASSSSRADLDYLIAGIADAVASRPATFRIGQREFALAVQDTRAFSDRRGG